MQKQKQNKIKALTILSVKPETIKLQKKKHKKKNYDLCLGKDFLDITSKAQFKKKQADKSDFIKIKIFCSLKDTFKKNEKKATD